MDEQPPPRAVSGRGRLPRARDWLAGLPLAALDWRLMATLFVGTLILVGTAGLMNLRGLQGAVVTPWVSWLGPYYPRATPIPWLPTLLVYDLPIVVLALAGIAVVIRRNHPFEHFLLWWTTLAALPLVFQPPDPLPYLIAWLLPLALLGGVALGNVAAPGWTWGTFGEDVVLAGLSAITFVCAVNTLRLVQSLIGTPGGLGSRWRELALSVLVLAFLALMHWHARAWWRAAGRTGEPSRPLRVSTIVAIVLGLVFVGVTNGRLQYADYGAGGPELSGRRRWHRACTTSSTSYRPGRGRSLCRRSSSATRCGRCYSGTCATCRRLAFKTSSPTPFARRRDRSVGASGRPGPAPEGERQPLDETITVGPIPSTGALWNWWVYRNAWLVPTRHDIIVVR